MGGMDAAAYTDRHLTWDTVAKLDGDAITGEAGWTALAPKGVAKQLRVGDEYGLEMKGGPFGRICGWLVRGVWVNRASDQQLDQEHRAYLAKIDRERRERLDHNRAEWTSREQALPAWLRERLSVFHDRGGERFEVEGWGYELTVAELAGLYSLAGGEDNAAIREYADRAGTSGNQHDVAKALAQMHADSNAVADTISALTPLTGEPFYEARPAK